MEKVEKKTTEQTRQLNLLARLYNVQTAYYDIFGRRRQSLPESLIPVLRALGAPVEDIKDVGDALRERCQSLWRRPLEPVMVAWNGIPSKFKLRLPTTLCEGSIDYHIALENGQCKNGSLLRERPGRGYGREVEGVRYSTMSLSFPDSLPCGYHQLRLKIGKNDYDSLIISSPLQAYTPPDKELREWGIFLPLYALQSQNSWGAGDFSDLGRLIDWIKELGGEIVSTLPLLAAFLDEPFDPSPYSPVTRLFWNEFYVDVTRIPELEHCGPARQLLDSADFHQELHSFRSTPLVDYRAQMALKRKVLEHLASGFFGMESERYAVFRRFVESYPGVEDYARFRAMTEKQKKTWMQWPGTSRDGVLNAGDYEESAKQYHLYVQWLAHEQLTALGEKARQDGPALYLDFPLGVHRDGYDVWRERSIFALGINEGAPPDDFFIKGQNWGFPPFHPEHLRHQGYRYYIACLRHHLRHAQLLRIDHVMGYHRLFWIPDGSGPSDGVYVRYPAEEFYAILSLESHKHRARIVGENLGTVPSYINEAMSRHKILGLSVAQFRINPDPERALGGISHESVASMNTHDTVTFAGFWHALDIDERLNLSLLDEAAAAVERDRRQKLKEALVTFLQKQGLITGRGLDLLDILSACLFHLSASDAPAILINLEDLWEESLAQNVPGTREERPNWRRKARYTFEQFSRMPQLCDMLKKISKLRKGAREAE